MPELGERGVQFGSGFDSKLEKAASRVEVLRVWSRLASRKARSGTAWDFSLSSVFLFRGSTKKMRPGASSQGREVRVVLGYRHLAQARKIGDSKMGECVLRVE